ncbi:hypothetical protein [Tropicibacter sp. S64]|uniref:hypothetical protein n=1 Tax=Tropicibacter sp. S64 TaxID=3415122 RepID=UPI003C7CDC7E
MRLSLPILSCLVLSACSTDPLARLNRVGDIGVAEDAGQRDALPDATETILPQVAPPQVQPGTEPERGLLGFLKRRADAVREAGTAESDLPQEAPGDSSPDTVVQAAVSSQDDAQLAALSAEPKPEPRKGGLFGWLSRADAPEVEEGTPVAEPQDAGAILPHGAVARVCEIPARSLGIKAESFPGRGGYTLYDSAPGSTDARNFYLDGFDDGCLRQFTAALVLFGSVESYEQIHYGAPGVTLPRAETDIAYEQLKAKVCGVAADRPCGSRLSRLSRNTAFVSIYERFEDNARWSTMLVHDGAVLAVDTKD